MDTISVTPNRNEIGRKRDCVLRPFRDVRPRNLMSTVSEAYMISMKGNIDLLFFEQGVGEAFVHPLVDLLFPTRESDGRKEERKKFFEDTKIIAVVPRRTSFEVDEPVLKSVANKDGTVQKYKMHYFVRYDPSSSTLESKKKSLQAAVEVRSG
jgi:hypothetical protein